MKKYTRCKKWISPQNIVLNIAFDSLVGHFKLFEIILFGLVS